MRGGKEGEGDTLPARLRLFYPRTTRRRELSPPPFYRWGKLRFPRSNMPEVRLLVSAGI